MLRVPSRYQNCWNILYQLLALCAFFRCWGTLWNKISICKYRTNNLSQWKQFFVILHSRGLFRTCRWNQTIYDVQCDIAFYKYSISSLRSSTGTWRSWFLLALELSMTIAGESSGVGKGWCACVFAHDFSIHPQNFAEKVIFCHRSHGILPGHCRFKPFCTVLTVQHLSRCTKLCFIVVT